VTLETGCGLSTIVILLAGVSRHFAVAPSAEEFDAITDECRARGVDMARLVAVLEDSAKYLPHADLPALDLVLIDGDHAFPFPFLDWYYTADRLKVGGVMVVDDVQIVTGRILADFMAADPKWHETVRHPSGRFAIYQKLVHPIHAGGWDAQPYVFDTSPVSSIRISQDRRPGRLERALARVLPWHLVQVPLRARFNWPKAE
jgi:hypothetical protein